MIKTLNTDEGIKYCTNEWNVPLIFCKKNKSMKNPYLNILMQIRQFTQTEQKYCYPDITSASSLAPDQS